MIFTAYGAARRLGVAGWRFGLVLVVRRLLHHQNPPAPNNATRITPTIATLIAQRIASFAIKKNIASKITPAIMKMAVKLMKLKLL
jgi:hypothetical protein